VIPGRQGFFPREAGIFTIFLMLCMYASGYATGVCVLTGGRWVFLSSPATQRSACACLSVGLSPRGELRWLCSALSIRERTQPVRGARVLPWPPVEINNSNRT